MNLLLQQSIVTFSESLKAEGIPIISGGISYGEPVFVLKAKPLG